MNKDKKIRPRRYALVYYELLYAEDYPMTLEEYLILDAMKQIGSRNECKCSLAFLAKYVSLSRNTVLYYLSELIRKGYLEKEENFYCIYYLIGEKFDFSDYNHGDYFKVYHGHKSDHGLSIRAEALLYLFYSLSRRWGYASASCKTYTDLLKISERHFYSLKAKLFAMNFIERIVGNEVHLSPETKDWYDNK